MNEQVFIENNDLDYDQMIKDAEWQVEFYKKELLKVTQTLYTRELALSALRKQKGIVEVEVLNDRVNGLS